MHSVESFNSRAPQKHLVPKRIITTSEKQHVDNDPMHGEDPQNELDDQETKEKIDATHEMAGFCLGGDRNKQIKVDKKHMDRIARIFQDSDDEFKSGSKDNKDNLSG